MVMSGSLASQQGLSNPGGGGEQKNLPSEEPAAALSRVAVGVWGCGTAQPAWGRPCALLSADLGFSVPEAREGLAHS